MRYIDMRSDTVTQPTDEMREAMFKAEVGDDVYGDDPTVRELEEYAAGIVGKEAALYVPSGTFGNQLALFTHCRRGNEVILGDECHIVAHEAGASSVIAGVQLRTVRETRDGLNPDDIESRIRNEKDIHYPDTGLICVENALSNGTVVPLENMSRIFSIAKKYNVPIHLDGARLFNASAFLRVGPEEITKYCDSVMFCLSKGLCAPVGSILAGTTDFVDKARKGRKLMGGGMRQAGFLAAAGLVALRKMRDRLSVDHENARLLASELAEIPGIKLDMKSVQINMVFFDLSETGFDGRKLAEELLKNGIKANPPENGIMRLVTNYWVSRDNVLYTVDTIRKILAV